MPALDQGRQDPPERLLGDAEDAEQLAHRNAGAAADEVQHAVVRPAHAELRQDRVGAGGEVAVAEEQQVLRQPQLLLAQEQQGTSGGRRGRGRGRARVAARRRLDGRRPEVHTVRRGCHVGRFRNRSVSLTHRPRAS